MTESSAPPPSDTGTPPSHLGSELRALRRSRSDRVVAGVLGGLGPRLGVDPLLLRIVTVVLAVFGGVGILLYAAAWLLIPAEGDDASVAEHALRRHDDGSPRTATVALGLGLMLVVIATAAGIFGGSWDGGVLLLLAGLGLVALLRRDERPAVDSAPYDDDPTRPMPAYPDYPGYPGYPGAVAPASSRWWTEVPEGETGQQAVPEPRHPRSVLGPVTASAAAVAVGGIALIDAIGADVSPATYVATALAIVGLGLLAGTWWGRSRGLIALGIALCVALVPAVAMERFDNDTVDVAFRPTTPAQLPSGTQEYGAGDVLYDLSDLELTSSRSLRVDQGVGELTVIVPSGVDVVLDAEVGVGEITAFGESAGGMGQERRLTDDGDDGPDGSVLTLELELGAGQIEVRR